MKYINILITIIILVSSFVLFYFNNGFLEQISKDYIGILIFFFATIVGVFVGRQGRRYNLIVKSITDFNGNLSYQYRNIELLGKRYQDDLANIIKKHFSHIDNSNYKWDWFIKVKTTTLTDINRMYMEIDKEIEFNKIQSHFINRAQASLLDMHKIRKNLVPLMKENIPLLQWIVISLLAFGLIISISSFNSYLNFSESLLKSLFITSIFSIILTLHRMNNMTFYEEVPGQSSSQDVLDIINNKK